MKKRYFILPIFILGLILVGCQKKSIQYPAILNLNSTPVATTTPAVNQNQTPVEVPTTQEDKSSSTDQVAVTPPFPSRLVYQVPFTSQAPLGVWDELHEESCEEAAMIMADAYFNHKSLTKDSAEQKILNLIEWENDNNFLVDLDASEVKSILGQYFSLSAELISPVTPEIIKQQLNLGRLLIVPTAGRTLGNPNFTGVGPIYHMILIKGYDSKNFITNDPGTRRGENYPYSYQILIDAVHDWQHELAVDEMTDAEMATGPKVIIAVYK